MYKISLNRVHDTVKVTEGNESLVLRVDSDPKHMVIEIRNCYDAMRELKADSPKAEQERIAEKFSVAIFGEDQTEKLLEFYKGNVACVMDVCGRYFTNRLNKLIIKAQKR